MTAKTQFYTGEMLWVLTRLILCCRQSHRQLLMMEPDLCKGRQSVEHSFEHNQALLQLVNACGTAVDFAALLVTLRHQQCHECSQALAVPCSKLCLKVTHVVDGVPQAGHIQLRSPVAQSDACNCREVFGTLLGLRPHTSSSTSTLAALPMNCRYSCG